jgi:hypothetical protein
MKFDAIIYTLEARPYYRIVVSCMLGIPAYVFSIRQSLRVYVTRVSPYRLIGRSVKLLLALASTVDLCFGSHRVLYFCSFHEFCVFWNGASSSTTRGVWLLLVTTPLLGGDSLTGSLLHTHIHTYTHLNRARVKVTYDWRFTANQFEFAPSTLRPTTRNVSFQLNPCGNSPYVTSSPTRRLVCFLWLCLAFRQVYVSHT